MLERKVFDRVLSEMAARAGADIIVKAPVVGITKDKKSAKRIQLNEKTLFDWRMFKKSNSATFL